MHSDLKLAHLSPHSPLPHPAYISSQFFTAPLSFPGWHHLSVSDYNFCQYYLNLPFCSAPGVHADSQWSCQIWQRVERKNRKALQEERQDLGLRITQGRSACYCNSICIRQCNLNFFKGVWVIQDLEVWMVPTQKVSMMEGLLQYLVFQTAMEKLLQTQRKHQGVVCSN